MQAFELLLPTYTALIEWLPLFRFEIEKVAWPDAFKVFVPSDLVPSLNVIVPVGTTVPGAITETVAVKVTAWLCRDGFREELTDVVVEFLFTVWTTGGEVLEPKLEFPL